MASKLDVSSLSVESFSTNSGDPDFIANTQFLAETCSGGVVSDDMSECCSGREIGCSSECIAPSGFTPIPCCG